METTTLYVGGSRGHAEGKGQMVLPRACLEVSLLGYGPVPTSYSWLMVFPMVKPRATE